MKPVVLIALTLATLSFLSCASPSGTPQLGTLVDPTTESELRALRDRLMSALERGDRTALEEILAPGFLFIHSTGVLETRQQFIERAVDSSANASGPRPKLQYSDEQIRLYGTTAIWTTRSSRPGTSQGAVLNFRGTDVLVRSGTTWQWASVHSTRLP